MKWNQESAGDKKAKPHPGFPDNGGAAKYRDKVRVAGGVAAVKARQTEAAFTAQVLQLAKLMGWRVAHFRPAMTSKGWRTAMSGDIGWPDLFLVRGCRCIAAELKVGSKLRPEQQAWLLALGGAGIEVHIWRPSDWDAIERTLAR